MDKLHTEGIIVRAFPFQDHDRILSLFTPEAGLIKLCVKGAYLKKSNHGSASNPLNHVEVIYKKGKSEIHSCYDIEVLNHHLPLRQALNTLECACDMLQTVGLTQYPEKPSPKLYALLLIYLKKLSLIADPMLLSTSFRLKTLKNEGLLHHSDLFPMTGEERQLVEVLTLAQDISLLMPLTIDPVFAGKIKDFFLRQTA